MVHVKGPVFFLRSEKRSKLETWPPPGWPLFTSGIDTEMVFPCFFFLHRKKSPRMSSYLTDSPEKLKKKPEDIQPTQFIRV